MRDGVDDIYPHRRAFGGLCAVALRRLVIQVPDNIHSTRMGCEAVGGDNDTGCG